MSDARFSTILITGASAGIGAALARQLARDCDHLILAARNEHRLHQLAHEIEAQTPCQVAVIVCDLSQPDAALALFTSVKRRQLSVDLLINNAGAGLSGSVLSQTPSEQASLIALNITALTQLSRLFAETMVNKKKGLILNVASTGAYQPGPFTAVYYAAKSYVHSFTLALDRELAGTEVQAALLCPGATASEFSRRAGKRDVKGAMTPESVASVARTGLLKRQKLIIPGWNNRLVITISKILPGSWLAYLVANIQKPLLND